MLPHAQRSLTAVPFIVLGLTAVAVVITQHWATFPALAVAVAVIFGAWFLPQYFNEFPQASVENFETFIRSSKNSERGNHGRDSSTSRPPQRTAVAALVPSAPRKTDEARRFGATR
jgi:hypothetical protein